MQSLRERFASRNIEISLANDSLPIVRLTNPHASAVVSLYGAHIFAYVPRGSRNVLWLSSESNFTPGKPVRGGIPVCWPWFGPGPEEGMPAHGLARISLWNLEKIEENSDGSTTLTLTLDKSAEIGLKASALIRVGSSLSFELTTENFSARPYTLTSALHSYFAVSDIASVSVSGLDGAAFTDKVSGQRLLQQGDILFQSETDWVFDSTESPVIIHDPVWKRSLLVEKSGSRSTVVWNPWVEKSRKMADFGDREYHSMLCVETANAGADARVLQPGARHTLAARITEMLETSPAQGEEQPRCCSCSRGGGKKDC